MGRKDKKKQRDPDEWCGKGQEALEEGDAEAAVVAFERALEIDPGHRSSLMGRVIALWEAEAPPEDVLAAADHGLGRWPDQADLWSFRATALVALGREEDALAALDKATRLDPTDADRWRDQAEVLLRFDRFEEALAAFDEAGRLAPDETGALTGRAFALHALARYAEARAAAEKSLAAAKAASDGESEHEARELLDLIARHEAEGRPRADRQVEYWCQKALLHFDEGDLSRALATLDRAAALDPAAAAPWVHRGAILARAGRTDESLAAYEKALALDPRDAGAWARRGHALAQAGRRDDSIEAYRRALALDPTHPGAVVGLATLRAVGATAEAARPAVQEAMVLERDDRYEEAIGRYDEALAIDPHSGVALAGKADSLRALDRAIDSLPFHERAIQAAPDHPVYWTHRGLALADLERADDAFASYQRAIDLAPRFPFPWLCRAELRLALEQPGPALADFEKALELEPELADAMAGKACALHALGRKDEARRACYAYLDTADPDDDRTTEITAILHQFGD